MDSLDQVDLVLLDFSEAFDTVVRNKLSHELTLYGSKQSNTHTTQLTSRRQRVSVER